jgi:hypothetical protein
MAPAWKVGWVQALGGSNPPFSAKMLMAPPSRGRHQHVPKLLGFGEEKWWNRFDGARHSRAQPSGLRFVKDFRRSVGVIAKLFAHQVLNVTVEVIDATVNGLEP